MVREPVGKEENQPICGATVQPSVRKPEMQQAAQVNRPGRWQRCGARAGVATCGNAGKINRRYRQEPGNAHLVRSRMRPANVRVWEWHGVYKRMQSTVKNPQPVGKGKIAGNPNRPVHRKQSGVKNKCAVAQVPA